jgi:hypothetical protein
MTDRSWRDNNAHRKRIWLTGVPDPKGDAADSWVESVRLRRFPRRAGALSFSAGECGALFPDPGHRARNYPGIQSRSRIGVAVLMGYMSAARRSILPHPRESGLRVRQLGGGRGYSAQTCRWLTVWRVWYEGRASRVGLLFPGRECCGD